MVKRVLFQKLADGDFASPNTYLAWRGFHERGLELGSFTFTNLSGGQVALAASTMLVGGAGAMVYAFRQLGVQMPAIDDLPESLAFLRGRQIWTSTLGEVQSRSEHMPAPLFVKPLRDSKAFPGKLVRSFRDVLSTVRLPDDLPVLVSEAVNFVSEWRFYILNGEVIGAGCYAGDSARFPDGSRVGAAVRAWGAAAPAGYAIDLGLTDDGRTLLVEVNDGYSLGCMGLKPMAYSLLLQARWTELVRTAHSHAGTSATTRPGIVEGELVTGPAHPHQPE